MESPTINIEIVAPKWTGGIRDMVSSGSIVKAVFYLTSPVVGEAPITINQYSPSDIVRIEKAQDLAGKMCAHVGAKVGPVGFKIPAVTMPAVKDMIEQAVARYDAEQDAIRVDHWEWTTRDDRRVHLHPVPEKHSKATAALLNRVSAGVSEHEMIAISERIGETTPRKYNLDGDVFVLPSPVKYRVSDAALMALLAEKDRARDARVNAAIQEARETGAPVLLEKWTDECDDPREDCSMDIVYRMAYPDGRVRVTRSHTW